MRINLIYNNNQAGTPRTAGIVSSVLEAAGATLSHSPLATPPLPAYLGRVLRRMAGRPHHDTNLFLEQVRPRWFPLARRNVLIPNQEWFDPSWVRHLPAFDLVLTKTREGERRFLAQGAVVEYIGFTARDQRLDHPPPPTDGVLHLAGRSLQKGTEAVLRVWAKHPEWPTLTVVQRPPKPGYQLHHPPLPNVEYRTGHQSDEEIRALQNAHRLHLCPSLAEGFGHTLAESLSCGAVLITTDAPPMNELVTPDRGVLVPASPAGRQGVGQLYRVDEVALEEAIAGALLLPLSEQHRLGANARAWFESNDRAFRARLPDVLLGLA